jgi:hypothetical protein
MNVILKPEEALAHWGGGAVAPNKKKLKYPCKRDFAFSATLSVVYKNIVGSQPEDGFMKKPKQITIMVF